MYLSESSRVEGNMTHKPSKLQTTVFILVRWSPCLFVGGMCVSTVPAAGRHGGACRSGPAAKSPFSSATRHQQPTGANKGGMCMSSRGAARVGGRGVCGYLDGKEIKKGRRARVGFYHLIKNRTPGHKVCGIGSVLHDRSSQRRPGGLAWAGKCAPGGACPSARAT